jgi:hypothetical protein
MAPPEVLLVEGFRPLEELRGFWNEENPCLIMVKHLCGAATVVPWR